MLFRYWYHNACVKNGPSQRVCFVDRQTRVLLSTCHRQSQGIYTKFLPIFDSLIVTLSFDEFFPSILFQLENCFFRGFFSSNWGVRFVDRQTRVLLSTCHRQSQGIYTKFLSTFDSLIVTLSFDEFFLESCFNLKIVIFTGFFVKLRGPFRGRVLLSTCHRQSQGIYQIFIRNFCLLLIV